MNPRKYASILLALLLAVAPGFAATVASNTVTVPVNLSIPESISLTPNVSQIVLSNSQQSAQVILTAGWQIQPGHTTATIYSWMSVSPSGPGGNLDSSLFSTQYNGGTAVACNQSNFPASGAGGTPVFGLGGRNCGTFAIPNIGTDLNDSQAVTLTFTGAPSIFNGGSAVGTYTGGVLNILLQIL
jgi:hypothetical protein